MRTITTPAATIELRDGELYAGLVLNADGTPRHHLILLPDQVTGVGWQKAVDWATAQGGELPTRQEQALLYAHCKSAFELRWYWSSETLEGNGSYAWYQNFLSGSQYDLHKSYEGRARAVRRLTA